MRSVSKNQLICFAVISLSLIVAFSRYIFGPFVFLFDDVGSDSMALFFPRMLENQYLPGLGFESWTFFRGLGQNALDQEIFNPFRWPQLLLDYKTMGKSIVYIQLAKMLAAMVFINKGFNLAGFGEKTVFIGTTAYVLSGYMMVSSGWYGHTDHMLFVAAGIYAMELLILKKQWWPLGIVLFFMFGMRVLFFLEFMVIYFFLRWPDLKSENKDKWVIVTGSVKSGILSLLLLAPFLGTTIYNLINSPRVGGDEGKFSEMASRPIFEFVNSDQLLTIIYRTFNPDLLGTGSDFKGWNNYLEAPNHYIGLIVLLLVPQAFFLLSKQHKIIFGMITGFWMLLLLFPFFRYAFYAFAGDFYKSGVSIYLPFSMLFIGLKSFEAIDQAKKINLLVLALSLTVALALLYLLPEEYVNKNLRSFCTILLVLGAALLYWLSKSGSLIPYVAIAALTMLEMTSFAYYGQSERVALKKSDLSKRIYYNDYTKEAVSYLNTIEKPFYRIEKTYGSYKGGFNDASAQNYFSTKIYDSHAHNNYVSFLRAYGLLRDEMEENTRWIMGTVSDFNVQPFLGIKYMLSTPQTAAYVWPSMYDKIKSLNGIEIYKNRYPLGFGILIDQIATTSEFNKLIDKNQKQFSLYKYAIVDESYLDDAKNVNVANQLSVPGFFNSTVIQSKTNTVLQIEHFEHESFSGNILVESPSIMVFSIPFDPGWHARVDGKKAKLIPVDFGLTGLPLESGPHEVAMDFKPPFFLQGWILFFLGLVLIYFQASNRKIPFLKSKTSA